MKEALLNPPIEAAVCRRMIDAIAAQKHNIDTILVSRVLDRETYLQTVSKRIALDQAITELTGIYNREFNI